MHLNPSNQWFDHPLGIQDWVKHKTFFINQFPTSQVWKIFIYPQYPVNGYSATRLINPEDWQEIHEKVGVERQERAPGSEPSGASEHGNVPQSKE